MPPLDIARPIDDGRRLRLFARTALCGALCGLSWLTPVSAVALPTGGIPEVSAGGGAPAITTVDTRMNVTLNAPRTVLSWTTFDVTPDETVSFNFGARNWIVLNRITGLQPSRIEGIVEGRVGGAYGGNIWFTSQNSIIFGKGVQVDAGSLLAAIGTPDTSSFLNPSNNLFSFNGGDALPNARVFVLSNARLTAHGGMVALMAPTVSTRANAVVSATEGSVLYGSAKNFQIRLEPGAGGDFDLVDFIVPSVSDGADGTVAIDLGGDTRANSVFLAAVSKSAIGSAVINIEGMVTAQAARADGGDIVLSGGAGIANRAAAPSLPGAASTDIYLNKASASRDLQIQNDGRIFGRPWVRPPEELKDPRSIAEEADPCGLLGQCDETNGDGGNGNGNGFLNGGFAPLESVVLDRALVSALFDPTAISAITTGRDAKIQATAGIELGRIVASRDVSVQGPEIEANSLIANGALTARSTEGAVRLAGVGVMREGSITGRTDVQIDAITAPTRLAVTSGRDITIGDGVSSVTGAISLSAPQNVTIELASARIDTINAGASANLRGGALDIGTVNAPRVFARAESVKIGSAVTSGDLYVLATNGDALVASATAGDDVYVLATHGTASLGSATLTGGAADAVQIEFAGNPDAAGNGRVVRVESADFDARLGLGTGGVSGATEVTVRAGQDAVVDVVRETPASLSVIASRDATLKAPTVRLDSVTAGRDLTVGSTTGDFTLSNALTATRNVTITAAGALRVADVTANAGSVSLTGATVTAGAVSASEDLTLRALSGGVTTSSYRTGRDLIVQGSTLSLGSSIAPVTRDLSITSLGNFTSSAPLSAGRNLTLDVAGTASIGQASAGSSVRIVAGDLTLGGTITAPDAQIESRGAMRVGGSAGGSGFILDNAEFGQLRIAGQLRLYAGSTTGGVRGDLLLQDLTVNPSNTPNVAFLVGSANTASVEGLVAPTTSGGVFRIGHATDLSWRPNTILVSGAVGAATFSGAAYSGVRSFDEVRLAARQDILMGSQRFIDLVRNAAISDIDVAAGKPAGVTPVGDEINRVFISAGRLEVSADNKVVQQNTSALGGGQAVGVFFTGQFNPALIIDPPRLVELWGAFSGQGGQVVTGTTAGGSVTFVVVDTNGQPVARPQGANYRFNSCDVGTTNCAPVLAAPQEGVTGQMNVGLLTARDGLSSSSSGPGGSELSDEEAAAQVSSETLTSPPVLLGIAPPDPDEIVTDPVVTGAGSEEIWRQRRQKQ